MITINKPLTNESQDVKFESVTISKQNIALPFSPSGSLFANVTFGVFDSSGVRINGYVITYSGADYNVFWESFNNGRFLFCELVQKHGLGINVPDSIESDFTNLT